MRIICFVVLLIAAESQSALIRHTFVIEYFSGSPDGVYKETILGINGQFPGPTIEAHVGDTLQVDVINRIQDRQNTSIHWHGIHQKGTQWHDGAAHITQCPLAYLQTQRYSFELKQAGTFWYHSHVHSQYTEGLWGVLIVHQTPEAYSYDGQIVITLNDWYHHTATENERFQFASMGTYPYPESGLINGVGRYDCGFAIHPCNVSQQMRPVFHVQRNKTYRVHVINAAALVAFNFSIDSHPLQVIESDSTDVKDGLTYDFASIASGQRYSFLIKTNVESDDARFHIRAQIRKEIVLMKFVELENTNRYPEKTIVNVSAILQYSDSDEDSVELEPFSYLDEIPLLEKDVTHLDEMELGPLDGAYAPRQFDVETILSTEFLVWTDTVRRGTFNSTPFVLSDGVKPLLISVLDGEEFHKDNLYVEVEHNQIVQVIINNPHNGPHPLHLHGHDFWVLGKGKWNDGIFVEDRDRKTLVLTGPKRDTVMLEERSWIVIQFIADNPGVWLFHCHIDWHMLTGMSTVFVVGRKELEMLNVDKEARHVCSNNMYSIDEKAIDVGRDTHTDTSITDNSVASQTSAIVVPFVLMSFLQLMYTFAV